MINENPSQETLIQELEELRRVHDALKNSYNESVRRRESLQIALDHSQRQYQLLTSNSLEVIWTLDLNGQLSYISPSIQRLRGLTPTEAMVEAMPATMAPSSQVLLATALKNCEAKARSKDGSPVRIEVEQFHRDGHLIWVEMYIRAQLNNLGETIGFIGNSRDITRRKKSEKATQEIAESFETLVAKVPIGIYVLGLNDDNTAEFRYVSDRWCEIFQINREEAMTDLAQVDAKVHVDDREEFRAMNNQAIHQRKRFLWEGRMQCGDEERWLRIESVPVSLQNNEHQWYGAVKDITQRKQAENALRESETQLRELNAQKDKFFSIIAHDLMSPFNSILGFSELLIDQINDNDYEGIHEYATMIEQSSKQSVDLLTNLLEWSRAHTGRMNFSPAAFDLQALIRENTELFETIAAQKSITIFQNISQEIIVVADKQMISTVLRNLLANAIKFTHQGGQVTLSAKRQASEILISVSDNGVGIPAHRLNKLFRIDENESTQGTNQETGTGLGLLLCKEFIEKHDGKIWVESEIEKGSSFYLTLPHIPPPANHA
ncbi:PAS domain-containing sensor histidine kinase [Coraliomargarita algicola]|uniref:histidine kinase n=1 Tax=Coraliomargarita algicola TaxID=3092156 RepID=A0ABZ0RGY5_9BACT|nr:PAS domain-containing sensor histidine kinase [Coraliomargarita sp. J2-16]WPJ94812.1 PAS domain-containing sensor histidine kinase [Coraliomargarita sp. J2-16]